MESDSAILQIPDENEFFAFFEGEPVECEPSDGFWAYEVVQSNIRLRFSVDIFERSVQTTVTYNGQELCQVSHENATEIQFQLIQGVETLIARFNTESSLGTLRLSWKPVVRVHWSDLAH